MKRYSGVFVLLIALVLLAPPSMAQLKYRLNKPEREAWFRSLGFGMFIHWSMDVQVGATISHSMVGASDSYLSNMAALPASFNPKKFDPEAWAQLAKLACMRYMVFTAKHHSGFCMYYTNTTDFNIRNTPFGRDATLEVFNAFRKQGIPVGVYFSPDDFYFLYKQGKTISRNDSTVLEKNAPLLTFIKEQLRELLSNYGKIDFLFLDGMREAWVNEELATYCWKLDPDLIITRGGMPTPEQQLPDRPLSGSWEACYTLGNAWQHQPTNDHYKTGTELIRMLIETRAKGGNLLLNVGPSASGDIPIEQENLLREIALWNMVNGEAVREVEPLPIIRQDSIWFTKALGRNTVYAFVMQSNWKHGERREFSFSQFRAGKNTRVSVLGHNGKVVEYKPERDATPRVLADQGALRVSVVNGQRLYDNFTWPNPIVLKLEEVVLEPAR